MQQVQDKIGPYNLPEKWPEDLNEEILLTERYELAYGPKEKYTTYLGLAAEHGFVDICKLLLENGANPNQCVTGWRQSYTPSQMAVWKWQTHKNINDTLEIIRTLVKYGAYLEFDDLHGKGYHLNAVEISTSGAAELHGNDLVHAELLRLGAKPIITSYKNIANIESLDLRDPDILEYLCY